MERKNLRIGFADTFTTAINFFTHALGKHYDIIITNDNPEYLIYGDGNFGQSHRQYGSNVKKIFYTGENVRPNYDECFAAMTFDHENSPKHYRLPLYVIDMYGAVVEKWTDNYYQLVGLKHDYEKDYDTRKFCSFVVSNPRQEMRNAMFGLTNTYKGVDSAGPHLNNMGEVLPRDKLQYKLDFLNNYRFNICFENGSYPGYTTEKLFNALQVKTMPIYWGSPTVDRDFNTSAFINCHNFKTLNDVVKYVEHLDSPAGKQEYLDIIERPAFKNDIPNEYTDLHNLYEWWDKFVMEG